MLKNIGKPETVSDMDLQIPMESAAPYLLVIIKMEPRF